MKKMSLILFLTTCAALFSDSLPFNKDRRYDGKAVVLDLNHEQLKSLDKISKLLENSHWTALPEKTVREKWLSMSILLTEAQKKLIKKEKGFAPKRIVVWDIRKEPFQGCGCCFANEAFRFSATKIEIPIDCHYLCSDEDADRKWSSLIKELEIK